MRSNTQKPESDANVEGTIDFVRRIAELCPSLLAYWGADLRCRFANRAYARWFGVNPESMIGATINDLLGPELFKLNWPYIAGALNGQEQRFERIVPGKDGVQRHSLAHYIPDAVDGIVLGFVVQVTETTSLKAAEALLRASEQRFKALAESSPFGIYLTDARGRRIFTNARWRSIYGFDGVNSGHDDWVAALHAEDRSAVLASRDRCVARGEPFDMEFRVIRADAEIRVVHSRAHVLYDDSGAPAGFVGATEDITDRRLAEARLRASESLLERTGRLAGVGGWEVDLRSGEVTWSEHTRLIHEVGPDYQPTVDAGIGFYAEEARPVIRAAVDEAIASGKSWDLELPFVSATGRELWVRTLGEVEYDGGVPVRLTGAFSNISGRREQEAKLRTEQQARARSERHASELDRLLAERSDMLDVLAHEVRQPLNNASAALQSAAALMRRSGDVAASERLSRARTVMGSVIASIDNTLAVASLLTRPEPIHRIDTDVDVLLQLTIAEMPVEERHRIRSARARGTWTIPMDLGLMRLALRNLLFNALKYSPSNSPVTLRLTDSDDPLALIIEVMDRGPGFDRELVPHLFKRSLPRRRSSDGTAPGFGLGLYIVHRVMELHGGYVKLSRNGTDGATLRLAVLLAPET